MNKTDDLEYLMNPTLYDKYQKLSSKDRETEFLKDKQFYRKRIQQMSKECAKYKLVKEAVEPPKVLMSAFDSFSRQCILYFKTIDENEYYQKEYENMDENKKETEFTKLEESNDLNMNEMDTELLGNIPQHKVITMDEFIEKKKIKPSRPMHLPKQKNVNVKDAKYRTKGIKKNKSNE